MKTACTLAALLLLTSQAFAVEITIDPEEKPGEWHVPPPPPPVVTITFDEGGYVHQYLAKYWRYKRFGTKVILDGTCKSACTWVTLLGDDICATERSALWFHAPRRRFQGKWGPISPKDYARYFHIFPANIQQAITERGGLTTKKWMIFKATDLLKPCEVQPWAGNFQ